MTKVLTPCPFCGKSKTEKNLPWVTSNSFNTLYWVCCPKCGADGPGKTTEQKAINAWKRRKND